MIEPRDDAEQPRTARATQQDVAQSFDQVRDSYTEQIGEAVAFSGLERGFFIQVKSEHLLRLASRFCGDLKLVTALDLGCGIGEFHGHLQGAFGKLHAIDVARESVEHARAKHPLVEYQVYDGGRLPYASDTFDLVFTICVIHHVPPALWIEFIAEMHRVMAPGGLAVVFEHNPYNPVTQYVVRTCPIDDDAVLLPRSRVRRLLQAAHLNVVEARSILSVPPVNRMLSALDRAVGRLPFGAQYYVAAKKPASDRRDHGGHASPQ